MPASRSSVISIGRRRPESNRCTGLCRPLPKPLGHAAGPDRRGPGPLMLPAGLPRLTSLEFAEVVRRRHMVRAFAARTVPREVLDPVIDAGRRAPSAGFSQGCAFVVLDGPDETGPFWDLPGPDGVA